MLCWKCHKSKVYGRNIREDGRNVPIIVCVTCAEKIFGKDEEKDININGLEEKTNDIERIGNQAR